MNVLQNNNNNQILFHQVELTAGINLCHHGLIKNHVSIQLTYWASVNVVNHGLQRNNSLFKFCYTKCYSATIASIYNNLN